MSDNEKPEVKSNEVAIAGILAETAKTLKEIRDRDSKVPVGPNMDIFKIGDGHFYVDSEGNKYVNDLDKEGTGRFIGHVSDKKAKA